METYQKLWLTLYLISLLGNFGIGTWLYLERRNDKTNERIADLSGKVEQLDKDVDARLNDLKPRLIALEARIENAPTHDDLAGIHEKINSVAREISQLTGNVAGMSRLLNSIDDYLRTHK